MADPFATVTLPPIQEGYVRIVHMTRSINSAMDADEVRGKMQEKYFSGGFNFSDGLHDTVFRYRDNSEVLDAIRHSHGEEEDPRFRNGAAVVMDVPEDLFNTLYFRPQEALEPRADIDTASKYTLPKEFVRLLVMPQGEVLLNPDFTPEAAAARADEMRRHREHYAETPHPVVEAARLQALQRTAQETGNPSKPPAQGERTARKQERQVPRTGDPGAGADIW